MEFCKYVLGIQPDMAEGGPQRGPFLQTVPLSKMVSHLERVSWSPLLLEEPSRRRGNHDNLPEASGSGKSSSADHCGDSSHTRPCVMEKRPMTRFLTPCRR